ncbi:hypothetical protein KAK06_09160 [Ideonella sp. 4Y11]|uniref:Uncharacterized protein n=1 Tax=Ideonella aquatica TaxID=2824119 RepID=A0A941BKZ1_9BURK|nr:hypothetical protein [Ideonella aquatica]
MTNLAPEEASLSASGARLLPVPRIPDGPDGPRQRTVQGADAHGCRLVTPPAGLFGWVGTGTDT